MGTLATHLSLLLFNLLPPTFHQAVTVCRWLGMQYLWADSLCNVQDDSSAWEEQASEMGTIYENAFFTLAAHGIVADRSSILPSRAEYEVPIRLPAVEATIRVRKIPVLDFLSPAGVVLGSIGENPADMVSGRGWC